MTEVNPNLPVVVVTPLREAVLPTRSTTRQALDKRRPTPQAPAKEPLRPRFFGEKGLLIDIYA